MSNEVFVKQLRIAEQLADEMSEGGNAIYQAQMVSLVAGKLALRARAELTNERYQFFVKELAQAVIDEAGLSTSQSPH